MKAKTKIAGLLTVLMALSIPMVYADTAAVTPPVADVSHHEGAWHHHGDHDRMMAKVLNLTDDQVKQLKDSREKQEAAMKTVFEQMKSNREAFDAEIVKATPDMNKITAIQAQIKAIQSQMVDDHLNSMLEIKKIMTPEQFAGFMALENAKKMMMHRHGEHGKFDHKGKACKTGDKDND